MFNAAPIIELISACLIFVHVHSYENFYSTKYSRITVVLGAQVFPVIRCSSTLFIIIIIYLFVCFSILVQESIYLFILLSIIIPWVAVWLGVHHYSWC